MSALDVASAPLLLFCHRYYKKMEENEKSRSCGVPTACVVSLNSRAGFQAADGRKKRKKKKRLRRVVGSHLSGAATDKWAIAEQNFQRRPKPANKPVQKRATGPERKHDFIYLQR